MINSKADEVLQLQRTLSEVSGERDAARLALRRLCRTVDIHLHRLRPYASFDSGLWPSKATKCQGCGNVFMADAVYCRHCGRKRDEASAGTAQRLRELLKAMEDEVHETTASSSRASLFRQAPSSPGFGSAPPQVQSKEVLRQSLQETQRRCESLNSDMVSQAANHEELVESLSAVKDANKRLVEQIRFQSDEIETLTRQRVTDEERLEHSKRKHKSDQDASQRHAQRRLAAAHDSASRRHNSARQQLGDRLRRNRSRAELVNQDAALLHEEQLLIRRDAVALQSEMEALLSTGMGHAFARCQRVVEAGQARKRAAEEVVAELEKQLKSEQEVRRDTSLEASHRQNCAAANREDVQARLARDTSQLSSQLQALERTSLADREAWSEEQRSLQERLDKASCRCRDGREELQQLQASIAQLDQRLVAVESELQEQQQADVQLRRQVRESDTALAAAVNSKEHLQQQMEEQRQALQSASEGELAAAKQILERRVNLAKSENTEEANGASRRAEVWEEKLAEEEEAQRGIDAELAKVAGECEMLAGEVTSWRVKHDNVQEQRRLQEERLSEDQRDAALERVKLQVTCDQLSLNIAAAEADSRRADDSIEQFRRTSSDMEVGIAARLSAAESDLRAAEEQLSSLKRRWREASEARARTQSEVVLGKQQAAEAEVQQKQTLERRRRELEEQRVRLEGQLAEQQQVTQQARRDLEQARELGLESLRRTQEEQRSKLQAAEEAKMRAQEARRNDLRSSSEGVASQQRNLENLEQNLARLRQLVGESESNLGWIRQEANLEASENCGELDRLKEEVRSAETALQKAVREEADVSRQLEELLQKNEREQRALAKDLHDLCHDVARADLDFEVRGLDVSHSGASATRFADEQAMERENSQLRSFLSEQGKNPSRFQNLHNKLESHIERLQRHTEDLRHSLQSGRSSCTPSKHLALSTLHGIACTDHPVQKYTGHRLVDPAPQAAIAAAGR